jgi:hypothetical protein
MIKIMNMKTLNEVMQRPSATDSLDNYLGATDFPGWYVVLTHDRDSDCLQESNWRVALARLGGESDNVEIHRFGHWACGWWEALCVKDDKVAEGNKIQSELEAYPVLDDEDYSLLEHETATAVWNTLSLSDKIDICKEHDISIFAARHYDLPEDDCGAIILTLSG